jgi:hypothetical protein
MTSLSTNHIKENTTSENIYIGISIYSTPLFDEHNFIKTIQYIKQKFCVNKIIILIADEIEAYNQIAFGGKSYQIGKRKSIEKGKELHQILQSYITNMDNIEIIHWDQVLNDTYKNQVSILQELYQTNLSFQNEINTLAKEIALFKRPEFSFKKKKIKAIVDYILNEMLAVQFGLQINGEKYTKLIYVTYDNRFGLRTLETISGIAKKEYYQDFITKLGYHINDIIDHHVLTF